MSRSRRKRRLRKCICGRHLIPYAGHVTGYWRVGGCPVLERVLEHNERLRSFKEQRSRPIEDPAT